MIKAYFYWLVIFIPLFLQVIQSKADELEAVLDSPEVKAIDKSNVRVSKSLNRAKVRWAPKGSMLDMIFPVKGLPLKSEDIVAWLITGMSDYKEGKIKTKRKDENILYDVKFTKKKASEVNMKLIIPHPKHIEPAKFGLLEDIMALRPPKLIVEYSEEVQIKALKAHLYRIEHGGCALSIALEKGCLVYLQINKCVGLEEIVSFAEKLDYNRFNRKISS